MMIKNRFSLFLATILIIGFFFLALPEKGYSGVGVTFGCCFDSKNNTMPCVGCFDRLPCASSKGFCQEQGGVLAEVSGEDEQGFVCNVKCVGMVCDPVCGLEDIAGCCVISEGVCNGGQKVGACDAVGGAIFFPDADCSEVPECAPPPLINLSPTMATNDVERDHTVTATVDTDGIPEPGILVAFEVTSGPNAGKVSIPNSGECTPNDDCTTDANGEVSWTYFSVIPGTDIIVASYTDKTFKVIESNTVEKFWVSGSIPTLSEWGLIAMAGILGIIGFIMVIRRRKVAA